jgi:hypothetical protein
MTAKIIIPEQYAARLREAWPGIVAERERLAGVLLRELKRKLDNWQPVISALKELDIPFENAELKAKSRHGIIAGVTDGGRLCVLTSSGEDVSLVDPGSDELCGGAVALDAEFAVNCEEKSLAAGFAFVEDVKKNVIHPGQEINKKLKARVGEAGLEL